MISFFPFFLFHQIIWVKATDAAGWSPRWGHTSVVAQNRIWVIAGGDERIWKNDVWYSFNGRDWFLAIDSSPWTPRHGAVS
ncbi:MAG: hypothetical protein ABIK81_03690, partial [candidate division WOR-3 bacterium]